jgi:L-alanine-DL-glutamate epimerase-like enolase superfamily enzyme
LGQGIRAFKLKVGFGYEQDIENVKLMRKLIGSKMVLMLDANQAWDLETAKKLIKTFQEYNIEFIEEPLPADFFEGYAELRSLSLLKIAGGENLYGCKEFRRALELKSLDVIQPDVSKTGGITETLAICALAKAWNLPYALHMFGNAVGLISSLHFLSAVPGGFLQEMDINPNPFRESILESPLIVQDGCLQANDAPGLGINLKESILQKYEAKI